VQNKFVLFEEIKIQRKNYLLLMRKLRVLFSFFLSNCLFVIGVYSQNNNPASSTTSLDIPIVMPNSPDVSALMKYAETNVDLSTGTNTYTYNVFNIVTNGFTLPITITNVGSPIKPTEIASSVGLGWVLNAGGAISNRLLNGMTMKAMSSLCSYNLEAYNNIVYPGPGYVASKSTFNFAGISGSYFLNKDGGVLNIGDPTLKIEKSDTGVCITNADGIKFIFGSPNLLSSYYERSSKELGPFTLDYRLSDFCSISNSFLPEPNLAYTTKSDDYYFNYDHNKPESITAILLREIRFPNSNEKIVFTYDQIQSAVEQYSLLEEYSYVPDDPSVYNNEEYLHRNFQISKTSCSYIKSITWPNGEIEFDYSGRRDLISYELDGDNPGIKKIKVSNISSLARKLSDIKVKHKNGNLIKGFHLDYFYNYPEEDLNNKVRTRLYLKSITEYNNKEFSNPTIFSYLLLTNMAPYPSYLTNSIDYWGNYNYSPTNANPRTRIPLMHSSMTQWDEFYTLSNIQSEIASLELHPLYKPSTFTIVNHYFGPNRKIANHNDRTSNDRALFNMLNKVEYPTGGIDSFVYTLDTLGFSYNETEFETKHIIIGASVKIQKKIRMFGNGQNDLITNYHYNGGELLYVPQLVRSYFMASNAAQNLKPTDVYFSNPLNTQSGSLVNFRMVTESVSGIGKNIYKFSTNTSEDITSISASYDFKSKNMNMPSILDKRLGVFGLSPNYFLFEYPLDYFPYLYNDDFNFLNNKIQEEINYDLDNNIVNRKIYRYNFNNKIVPVIHLAILNDILKQRSTMSLPLSLDGLLIRSKYYFNSGYAELASIENRIYNTNTIITTDFLSNIVLYKYNKWRQLEEEVTINSDGTENIKEIKYLEYFCRNDNNDLEYLNYSSIEVEALKQLKQKNILSSKIVEGNFVRKPNEIKKLLNSQLYLYKNFNNSTVLWKEYYLTQNFLVSDYNEINIDQNELSLNMDYRYKLYRTYNSYNLKNLPLEIIDRKKGVISYKWSYNSELPVAEFINGYNSDSPIGNNTSYLGFESGTIANNALSDENNDFWLFNTENSSIVEEPFTGRFALQVNSSNSIAFSKQFKPHLNTNTLVIDGWVKISSEISLISGTTKEFNIICSKNDVQINSFSIATNDQPSEWKYFRVIVNIGNTVLDNNSIYNLQFVSTIEDSEYSLLFDDIRVYPENSSVLSVTYDEKLNLPTSISDANNVPTRFEYDGFGRLNYVLDYKGNMLKSNTYNLKFKRN
jgi:YD repeat-containing protein